MQMQIHLKKIILIFYHYAKLTQDVLVRFHRPFRIGLALLDITFHMRPEHFSLDYKKIAYLFLLSGCFKFDTLTDF